jgi:hypothetical protein
MDYSAVGLRDLVGTSFRGSVQQVVDDPLNGSFKSQRFVNVGGRDLAVLSGNEGDFVELPVGDYVDAFQSGVSTFAVPKLFLSGQSDGSYRVRAADFRQAERSGSWLDQNADWLLPLIGTVVIGGAAAGAWGAAAETGTVGAGGAGLTGLESGMAALGTPATATGAGAGAAAYGGIATTAAVDGALGLTGLESGMAALGTPATAVNAGAGAAAYGGIATSGGPALLSTGGSSLLSTGASSLPAGGSAGSQALQALLKPIAAVLPAAAASTLQQGSPSATPQGGALGGQSGGVLLLVLAGAALVAVLWGSK